MTPLVSNGFKADPRMPAALLRAHLAVLDPSTEPAQQRSPLTTVQAQELRERLARVLAEALAMLTTCNERQDDPPCPPQA